MDKDLQKRILEIIRANKGKCSWSIIKTKVERQMWREAEVPDDYGLVIMHQLALMIAQGKLASNEERPPSYTILPDGHRIFDSVPVKIWNFILYDRNNLWAILALLVSLVSLSLSLAGFLHDLPVSLLNSATG